MELYISEELSADKLININEKVIMMKRIKTSQWKRHQPKKPKNTKTTLKGTQVLCITSVFNYSFNMSLVNIKLIP